MTWLLQWSKRVFLTSWFSWALPSRIFPLCFTYLSKTPCSPISFLPTKVLPIFLKAPTTLTAGIPQLVFIHQGTRPCLLSGNAKLHSFQHGAPAEPAGQALPAGSREKALPDKGWRKQRAEETPTHRLWSANNFQPLENLRGVQVRFFFLEHALLSACGWWERCWQRWHIGERRF